MNRPEHNYKVEAVKHVPKHLTPWKVSVVSFAPATQMKDLLLPGYEHFNAWQSSNTSRWIEQAVKKISFISLQALNFSGN